MQGHGEGCEVLPAAVPLEILKLRAQMKFSGSTGAVVASGCGLATSAPTYGLVDDVVNVVDGLPEELFDKHVAHRPCGLLCRAGARGMLLGDVLGLPHMPWVLAEPVGKAALKLSKEIPEEKKEAPPLSAAHHNVVGPRAVFATPLAPTGTLFVASMATVNYHLDLAPLGCATPSRPPGSTFSCACVIRAATYPPMAHSTPCCPHYACRRIADCVPATPIPVAGLPPPGAPPPRPLACSPESGAPRY